MEIDRRRFLKAGTVGVAGALLPFACGRDREAGQGRANILLIITDDHSYRAIGYANRSPVLTPNLDRLAASGTIFDNAYCNAMPCTPSRGGIMTGLHYHRWLPAIKGPDTRLDPGEWTWAHALQQAGYRTGLIGKMHFSPVRADHGFAHTEYCEHRAFRNTAPGRPLRDDYERWLAGFGLTDPHASMQLWQHESKFHPISWVRDRSIAFIEEQRGASEPFCLTTSFRYPHPPFDPPREYAALYDPRSIEIPTDSWLDMEDMPRGLKRFDGRGWFPREDKTEAFLQRRFAFYYALVSQIDQAVGEIVEHVDLDNTLVLFTSDHGVYLGHRGRIDKHPFVGFDDVARVPMFALGHGVPPRRRVRNSVGLADLAPSILTAAGLGVPEPLDGEPLQRYFEDPNYGPERSIFCWGLTGFNMTRTGMMKYFRHRKGGAEMLFDLESDPGELRNLAAKPPWQETRARLAETQNQIEALVPPGLPRFTSG